MGTVAAVPGVVAWSERERVAGRAERIRVDSIATGAEQLRAVLTEILERNQ